MTQEVAPDRARELAKISILLVNLELAWEEIQENKDKDRVKNRVLPWLKKQIDNIRALGGDTDQIAKLEAYQVRFEAFIVIPVKKIKQEVVTERARELAKVSTLLKNLESIWKEVQETKDKNRVKNRVLPWLKKQIDNIRALGGDTDQIAKLEAYQVRFEAFIVIPVKKIDRLAQEPILSETPEWNREIAFTFDDSLAGSAAIISHLESQGITNYRFYGEAGTAIKD